VAAAPNSHGSYAAIRRTLSDDYGESFVAAFRKA
jgi:hypothetical protein